MSVIGSLAGWFLNEIVGLIPFVGVRMWLYERAGIKFADRARTTVMMHAELLAPADISIGAHSVIGRKCLLDGRATLTIGENVNIGSGCELYTGAHDPHSPDFGGDFRPVKVEDYAWLAVNVTVLPGVTIGRGAVVAAGSVVTRDLEPMKIYGGAPAREIGVRGAEPAYTLDYRPNGM
jgi:acetyltransferase-like isoleucine patch superfamily enzyme